ncbi:MAG: hypothetical protein ACOX6T_12360 [Myxococcales bacterium]|jgi:hypothetical protein
MNRALWLTALALALAACPKQQGATRPSYSGPPKAFKLLSTTEEAETRSRTEKREDLFVRSESGEPTPVVVAVGQVGPISRQGARVQLFGDEAGTRGWEVDNFVLLEIGDEKGEIRKRVAIGYQQGASLGSEILDTVGSMKFSFEPGEIDLSSLLPADEPFTIKATALDVGGVGRVSDLYLILSPGSSGTVDDDDLRNQ